MQGLLKKCLEHFEKETGFSNSLCLRISEGLQIHLNASKKVSPISLLNAMVAVAKM